MDKKHLKYFALIGIAAVVFLIILWISGNKNSSISTDTAESTPDNPGGTPSYPANPIQLGDISVGGSPSNLTYNTTIGGYQQPSIAVAPKQGGETECQCGGSEGCFTPSQLVTVNNIPASVIQSQAENIRSFYGKTTVLPALAALEAENI